MSFDIELISEPKVSHTSGTASDWSMSENPLLFKFQRKDLLILSITNLGSTNRLTFTSSPYWITVGDFVYYGNSIDNNTGEYLVTAVNVGSNYIEIGTPLTLGPLGFVNDTTNLQNYHVYIDLYKWLDTGLQGDRVSFAKFYDDPTGLITADLREYLDPLLDLAFPSYFGIATQHEGRDQDFSFTFRAGFVHDSIDPTLFTPEEYDTRNWIFKASAQLGDQFGQNMRRYMTYPALSTLTEEGLMHFNSMFDEPYYFDGYPFALSFVYSEKQIDFRIARGLRYLDINMLEFELLLNGSFDDTSEWTLNGTGVSISGGALKFVTASNLAYAQQELITPIAVGTDNYRVTIDVTDLTDKFFQLIAANGSTVVHQFTPIAGLNGELVTDFNTVDLSATAVFIRVVIDTTTSADDTGDVNSISVVKTFVDQLPYTIIEHGCVLTNRGIGAIPANVKGFSMWLDETTTEVESDGTGSGGGTGTGTGPGGSDQATLDEDILEADIVT